MARIVHVHHMYKDAFLRGSIEPDPDERDIVFERSPSYAEVLEGVRDELNWKEASVVVELEGRHNVGFGMHIRWKTMRINSEQRWIAYKETVAESQDKALELFATKKVDSSLDLDLNRRPPSPVHRRSPPPISQEEIPDAYIAHDDANLTENSDHEDDRDGVELNNNNVGDLDTYLTQENMDPGLPYSRCYASDSDDEGPLEDIDEDGFTAKEVERANIFKEATGHDLRIPLFRDFSLADEAVVDGGTSLVLGARPMSYRDDDDGIVKGLTFQSLVELKVWIKEYAVKHHRPYTVFHSDKDTRYTVICEQKGCPWIVRARPVKGGPSWKIVSCVSTHRCKGKKLDGQDAKKDHRQLTQHFLAYKLSMEIASLPTMTIKNIQDTVKSRFNYDVKYGKAWKAKQTAFKMLYGDWAEAYNRIPRLLLAMANANPGMVHVVEAASGMWIEHDGKRVRVFHRAFWAFEQCIQAFEH